MHVIFNTYKKFYTDFVATGKKCYEIRDLVWIAYASRDRLPDTRTRLRPIREDILRLLSSGICIILV